MGKTFYTNCYSRGFYSLMADELVGTNANVSLHLVLVLYSLLCCLLTCTNSTVLLHTYTIVIKLYGWIIDRVAMDTATKHTHSTNYILYNIIYISVCMCYIRSRYSRLEFLIIVLLSDAIIVVVVKVLLFSLSVRSNQFRRERYEWWLV